MRILFLLLLLINAAYADRIKDLANISGVRSNQLIGYGLVVGLDGTGDSSNYTNQSFKTMLSKLGVQLPDSAEAKSKSIAAVAISAELPAFAKPGQQIDVTVSSLGGAKSLRGGTLLLTSLKGIDGKVYAIAQGNLIVGGFGVEGKDGSQIKINVPVVGRIPGGATIEVSSPSSFMQDSNLTFLLKNPDFTTARLMSETINEFIGSNTAEALDGGSVRVQAPANNAERVKFVSLLENLEFMPGERRGKIIVNSRTGTIVIGKHVRVSGAAVSHGGLTVTISEKTQVSQPQALSTGTTQVTPQSNINVQQQNSRMFLFEPQGAMLDDIVRAVNEVGAAPGDLIAILEALHQSGALRAEVEVI